MANVLALEFVESVLRVFFRLKEAGRLSSHLTVLISAQFDRVLNQFVAVEERVYVIDLDREGQPSEPHSDVVTGGLCMFNQNNS